MNEQRLIEIKELLISLNETLKTAVEKQDEIFLQLTFISDALSRLNQCPSNEVQSICADVGDFIADQASLLDALLQIGKINQTITEIDTELIGKIYS